MTRRAGAGSADEGRRRARLARPVRPLVPIAGSATVLLAWGLVAHNSGAGWVQAVGDALAGTLAIGLFGPAVVAQFARILVLESPSDAGAGSPTELVVEASTRLRVDAVHPHGPQGFVGPGGVRGRDAIVLVPERRGAYTTAQLDIATAAPFGLLWWRRPVSIALARELVVAPRLGEAERPPVRPEDTTGETATRRPTHVGEPRGVRPYRAGDHRRSVHWPATAHTGDLMVRESEGPGAQTTTVEVHLPEGRDEAERAAERAFGTVVALLDRGSEVVLVTTEPSGPRRDRVFDRRAVGRRLARAVSDRGAPGDIGISTQTMARPVTT